MFALFAWELKSIFLSVVQISGRSKELWDQGCFTVKENSFCATVCPILLNLHEKGLSTAAATLKRRDYLSFHLCYTLHIYQARGVVEIGF